MMRHIFCILLVAPRHHQSSVKSGPTLKYQNAHRRYFETRSVFGRLLQNYMGSDPLRGFVRMCHPGIRQHLPGGEIPFSVRFDSRGEHGWQMKLLKLFVGIGGAVTDLHQNRCRLRNCSQERSAERLRLLQILTSGKSDAKYGSPIYSKESPVRASFDQEEPVRLPPFRIIWCDGLSLQKDTPHKIFSAFTIFAERFGNLCKRQATVKVKEIETAEDQMEASCPEVDGNVACLSSRSEKTWSLTPRQHLHRPAAAISSA